MTPKRVITIPVTPPPFVNHGNYAISLSDVVKWLAAKAEERGIEIYPGFAAAKPIFDGKRVVGVQVQDRGIDKDGNPKAVFEAGPEIHAKCVIFGEGTRGSCTKIVIDKLGLAGANPQAYETGIKEIWRIKPGEPRARPRRAHDGLAARPDHVRRRLDLRPEGQRASRSAS